MNITSFSSFATNTSDMNYESLPAASQWVSCNSELRRLLAVTFGVVETYPITNNFSRLSTALIALEYYIWNSIELGKGQPNQFELWVAQKVAQIVVL